MSHKILDDFVARLHKRCGICGHCGKKKCAGRESYSILPERLLRDDVLAVLDSFTATTDDNAEIAR